jgi:uncharacterized protein (TIGR02118 family)
MCTLTRRLTLVLAALVLLGGSAGALADAAKPAARRCITVLYPNGPDIKFDFDYYAAKHAPLIKRLYGKGIAKIELRRGVATQDGSPVPFVAVINIWIGSQKAFDAAAAKHAATLVADVPNFTNGKPVIQIDEIVD